MGGPSVASKRCGVFARPPSSRRAPPTAKDASLSLVIARCVVGSVRSILAVREAFSGKR